MIARFEADCGAVQFPTTCNACGEPERAMGPAKRRWIKCGCPGRQEAPGWDRTLNRTRSTAKTGIRYEKATRKAFARDGVAARLTPGSGAPASRSGSVANSDDLSLGNGQTVQTKFRTMPLPCKALIAAKGSANWLVFNAEGEDWAFGKLRDLTHATGLAEQSDHQPTGARAEGGANK